MMMVTVIKSCKSLKAYVYVPYSISILLGIGGASVAGGAGMRSQHSSVGTLDLLMGVFPQRWTFSVMMHFVYGLVGCITA